MILNKDIKDVIKLSVASVVAMLAMTNVVTAQTPPGDSIMLDDGNQVINQDAIPEERGGNANNVPTATQNAPVGVSPQPSSDRMAYQNGFYEPSSSPSGLPHSHSDMVLPGVEKFKPRAQEGNAQVTPEQITEVKMYNDRIEKAKNESVEANAKLVSRVVKINFNSPNSRPVLRLKKGGVTAVVVTDLAGNSWNVTQIVIGDKNSFSSKRLDGAEGSVLAFEALKPYKRTEAFLMVSGKKTPIPFDLIYATDEADSRVDFQINGYVPGSIVTKQSLQTEGVDSVFNKWVAGLAPSDAKKLFTSDENVKAWSFDGDIVITTGYTLLAPASKTMLTTAGQEMNLHRLSNRTRIITVKDSYSSEIKTVAIKGIR